MNAYEEFSKFERTPEEWAAFEEAQLDAALHDPNYNSEDWNPPKSSSEITEFNDPLFPK
jgi:hypothetical protein